jgi:hypothetical protein
VPGVAIMTRMHASIRVSVVHFMHFWRYAVTRMLRVSVF